MIKSTDIKTTDTDKILLFIVRQFLLAVLSAFEAGHGRYEAYVFLGEL